MKRIFISLISVVLAAAAAMATSFEYGELVYEISAEPTGTSWGTVRVTGLTSAAKNGSDLDITIPSQAVYNNNAYKVTSVASNAFQNQSALHSVTINYGCSILGTKAFYHCTNLAWVKLPSSVYIINERAFYANSKLTAVYIARTTPPSVGSNVFEKDNVTLYVTKAVPNATTTYSTTYDWKGFKSYVRSKDACDFLFSDGGHMCVTTAPTFGTRGEMTITGFTAVTSNENAKNGIFKPSSSYHSYQGYEYDIVAVADSAFSDNIKIKTADLSNCTKLNSIGQYAFHNCMFLTSVSTSAKEIQNYAFHNCISLKTMNLLDGVQNLDYCCFENCAALTSLSIPASVKEIHSLTFVDGCTKLEKFYVNSANTTFSSYNGVLYNKNKTILNRCPEGKEGTLTYKDFPSGLKTIYMNAFGNCDINGVYLPYGVKEIGNAAFEGSAMIEIHIPQTATTLGTDVFKGCSSLNTLVFNLKTPPSIASSFFADCPKATLMVPYKSLTAYQNASIWKTWESIIPGSVDFIWGNENDGSNIKSCGYTVVSTAPFTRDGVTYDGKVALTFIKDTNITGSNVTIPSAAKDPCSNKQYAVTSIDGKVIAYGDPYYDITLTLGANIDSVGEYAFMGQTKIVGLVPNPGLKYLGAAAFHDCRIANDIILPYGMTKVEDMALSCNKIKRILVPSSVKSTGCAYYSNPLEELILNNAAFATLDNLYPWWTQHGCKLLVPAGTADKFLANEQWAQCDFDITEGAYDFCYQNRHGNTPYYMTVTDATPVTVDGTTYAGKAKYVYNPGISSSLATYHLFSISDYETDIANGANKKYLMTEVGHRCLDKCTSCTEVSVKYAKHLQRIGNFAFYKTGITTIDIPATVNYIGTQAYDGCNSLRTVKCYIPNPITIENLTFGTTSQMSNVTLYVPHGKKDLYKAANVWKYFYQILEMEGGDTGITGDVNYDGKVDVVDLNIVTNIILGSDKASNYGGRADVTGDGKVDIADVNAVINKILGL